MISQDTIIALATPSGMGAIAIIRLSGEEAISICSQFFTSVSNKDLNKQKSHSLHLGHLIDGDRVIDQVLVSVFKNPHSYTGEDVIEISCHGSVYIQQEIIQLFLKNGVRHADAGEFTLRAFLNGKMDLSQAEAVADVIASTSKASHQTAIQQMRGGFSNELKALRQELLDFASLIELELDFAEEDVEFANRDQFMALIEKITIILKRLSDSFAFGNVMKNGIPITIIGAPNVGKSTLLNTLLNEEKAIVSEVPGTTRDAIEDEVVIEGVVFRFIDTAGLRKTEDVVESIGIKKAYEKAEMAQLIIYLMDAETFNETLLDDIKSLKTTFANKKFIVVANKMDKASPAQLKNLKDHIDPLLLISAKHNKGIETLKNELTGLVNIGLLSNNETIVTNSRHFEALNNALESINAVKQGIDSHIPSDLIAIDLRECLRYMGNITGEYDLDKDILGNIFENFCIGK